MGNTSSNSKDERDNDIALFRRGAEKREEEEQENTTATTTVKTSTNKISSDTAINKKDTNVEIAQREGTTTNTSTTQASKIIIQKDKQKISIRTKKGHATQYKISDFKRHFHHKKKITDIELDEKRDMIWSASRDKVIAGWKMNGEIKIVLQGHTDVVECLAREGDILYSGSHDRTIRIWDISEKGGFTCIDVLSCEEWISCILANGNHLYVGYYDKPTIDIYTQQKRKIGTLKGHSKRVTSMYLDKNEGMMYTASMDGTIRKWNIESGTCLKEIVMNAQIKQIKANDNIIIFAYMDQVRVMIQDELETKTMQYAGIEGYTVTDEILIGFNRNQQQIEVWHIPTQLLVTTIQTNVYSVSRIIYTEQQLYYSAGSQIFVQPLQLSELISYRENITETEATETTYSTIINPTLKTPEQPAYREFYNLYKYLHHNGTNQDVALLLEKEATILRTFDTFEEQLKHLTNAMKQEPKIYSQLEQPYQTNNLRKISNVSIMIKNDNMVNNESSTSLKKEDNMEEEEAKMDIEKNLSKLKKEYTEDEKVQDFETRSELFYKAAYEPTTAIEPTIIIVRRSEIVYDALKHFMNLSNDDLKKQMYIFFAGEQGLDMGGVTKAFYQILSEEILNLDIGLFEAVEHGASFHPSPISETQEDYLKYFYFVGKLIGKAIYDMQIMAIPFSKVIFKLIVGEDITFHDLQSIDPCLYESLLNLVKMNNVETCDLYYAIDDSFYHIVELVENGSTKRVTDANKIDFVMKYAYHQMIGRVEKQIQKLLEGIYSIIPQENFAILKGEELKQLLCGSQELSIDEWREHSIYEGFSDSMSLDGQNEAFLPVIDMFWEILKTLTQEQQLKVLEFVTGSACLPHGGWTAIYPRFTIVQLYNATSEHLPRAQTCINRLELPLYKVESSFRKKLIQAIEMGKTFSLS